jgi:hypothetical protein
VVRAVQTSFVMKLRMLAVLALALAACATASRKEGAGPPRAKDTVPDKIAAQRSASGNLRLQDEEDRWGFEAAQARRRDQKQGASTVVVPLPSSAGRPVADAGAP